MTPRILAAASIALVLAACGGNAEKKAQREAAAAATAQWRVGLRHWGAAMTKAIDGLSIVFSTPADVRGIQAGNKKVESKLAAFENVLFRCTQRVDSLGEAPPVLVPSRAEALAACKNLEKGARLVRDGITQLQGGQGVDLLNRSSDPLGSGQDEVRRALLDLAPAQG